MTEKLSPETVQVGQGVHYGVGSDRYPGTVVKVSESGKTIWFTDDKYQAAEGSNYYGNQEYTFESVEPQEWENVLGETETNVKTARWNKKKGGYLFYGRVVQAGRAAYFDPSF